MAKIFIDGEAGTTGLQIQGRLQDRDDIDLLHLGEGRRKDTVARAEMLNEADISILCLPEDASREAVALIENDKARVIDASIAYRIDPDWAYGFPEYQANQRDLIASATRVSNPGCYACSSISIIHPLVTRNLLPSDFPITINAISGYSGGGKSLIAAFEDQTSPDHTDAEFYLYGLGLAHKHTPEIQNRSGLDHAPVFVPSVGRFAQGMLISVPLQLWSLEGNVKPGDIHAALADHYAGQRYVQVAPLADTSDMASLDPEDLNDTNMMKLFVFANDAAGQAVVCAQLDNLGKGASGQAVQNLNLMLGLDETTGLQ
ncbi:MAG: N-acetyl-gamma-glutamyl-phosphate reductase [Rhodospirillales bacterium]|jgi:N-acetyl-gamma-glutamyl-phosphate reductase